ncbi:MAG: DNA polymerase III subunit epsilon [SAR86 cluster bacterium]|jgi:DNA polymerase-3 subunit epsilon|nr:DNA polymerase III subunit epsilon [Gammaproteobacteria bacterium]MDB2678334.1 DNA polymerase III subunit epsilon [Gammaproteobacteria bacterium]MDC0992209.1 DNA polymerase III subunit epsilon [Gammaproteobacteria bacterium]MDG1961267.1 DNA polymerase III subunit epsilon [SAR86 cluster bacterium]|tara:strand:- start:525 stop:1223 length:699 start_codon:yes stop_codon:yes gene_type:complete
MIKKLIVLDTETTGLEVDQGHRIVEVGAVALADRKRTDLHFHSYLNPQRSIDEEAEKVHGLSMERLSTEPEFSEIAESFLEFVEGSILVIHNAAFDLGFLNAELKRASSQYPALEEICDVEDTLLLARNKFPGQRNSLDALANRFEVTGYDRSFHGALLDANILADVYIHLTGGQSKFEFMTSNTNLNSESQSSDLKIDFKKFPIPKIKVSEEDILTHDQRITAINSKRESS